MTKNHFKLILKGNVRFFIQLIGFALLLLGLYYLGRNIIFTTNVSPYWWRGIAADVSVLFLTLGVLMLTLLPLGELKQLGWVFVAMGIVCVFVSSRAILNPTSLWQYFVAMSAMGYGYKLVSTGRLS